MYVSYLFNIVFKSSSDLFSKFFLFSILLTIISLLTLRKKIKIKVTKGTPGDFLGCYADVEKINKDFKFRPKTDLKRGLKLFNAWLDTLNTK